MNIVTSMKGLSYTNLLLGTFIDVMIPLLFNSISYLLWSGSGAGAKFTSGSDCCSACGLFIFSTLSSIG